MNILSVGIIIFGLLLPLVVRVIAEYMFKGKELLLLLSSVPALLIAPGENLLIVALLNDIPFIAFALVVRHIMKNLSVRYRKFYYHNITGLICAAFAITILSIDLNYSVWSDVFIHASSTAVIAFMFLPVYGLISLVLGYSFGFGLVWALKKLKRREKGDGSIK